MAHAEPSTVSVTSGGEDGGVPARKACSSNVAGDQSYVTASSHESVEYETPCRIEISREQGWSELTDGGHAAAAGYSGGSGTRGIWEELKKWAPRFHWKGAPASGSRHDQDALIWEELKTRYPRFFRDDADLELGRLIAEGGQAHIYEAQIKGLDEGHIEWVAKVFKMEGFSLADFQRHWPRATKDPYGIFGSNLGEVVFCKFSRRCSWICLGIFLKDGRFTFLMPRHWGDLRTLINIKLSDNNFQRLPFSFLQIRNIIRDIASGIKELDEIGVLHRDLEATNILVKVYTSLYGGKDMYSCHVVNFGSSLFVQGTRF